MATHDEEKLAINDGESLAVNDGESLAINDVENFVINDVENLAVKEGEILNMNDEENLAMNDEDNLAIQDTESMALAIIDGNDELHTPEVQPNKRRKKKSMVWEHFTIETVSPGCRRAYCNQCKQSFAYSTGSKVAGTSHLKRHIAKGACKALLRSLDTNKSTPYTPSPLVGSGDGPHKRRHRSPSTPYVVFDQDHCRLEIAKMIILQEYPLHIVEHSAFVSFVQNLQPRFNTVSFNTVQGDCVSTYLTEKQNLAKFVDGIPGRICLTLDMWHSSRSVGYVFVTGHFIDSDWKLNRRILNVVMEPYPESDAALSHAIAVCLSDWNLEGKLFSLTFNEFLTEAGLENLRALLAVKNPFILNGQFLIGSCMARTLSSIAKDVLSVGEIIVEKIRNIVKYVKTSESHEEKFLEIKQELQNYSRRSLFVDDQNQWDTTYKMLVAAFELKEVFSCLDAYDSDYKAPSMEDWKLVETIYAHLRLVFDAANNLTSTATPSAITFFHEVWKLHSELSRSLTSEDPFTTNLSKIMFEKVDKYWKDFSLVLASVVAMDPRFKMKLVDFSFTKVYGEEAPTHIKAVDDGIHELFDEYTALPLPVIPTYVEEGNGNGAIRTEDGNFIEFDAYIIETSSQQMKSELEQYLEESLSPRVQDFDVLRWWKENKVKYPTLSKMAQDILSIPVCTLPAESVFDMERKEMDHYRSSLRPETVEALICAKEWMQGGSVEASNAVVKTVF